MHFRSDAGVIRSDIKEYEKQGSLQCVALGLRTTGGNLVMDFVISHPLAAPTFLEKREVEFYTSIKYSF